MVFGVVRGEPPTPLFASKYAATPCAGLCPATPRIRHRSGLFKGAERQEKVSVDDLSGLEHGAFPITELAAVVDGFDGDGSHFRATLRKGVFDESPFR